MEKITLGGPSIANPHSQARNSVHYTILRHDTNEVNTIPLDQNLLTFRDSNITMKFFQVLYTNQEDSEISHEFSQNIIKFYLYLLLTLGIIIYSVESLYAARVYSYNVMIIHVICIFVIFAYSLVVLFLVIRTRYFLLHNRGLFCGLGCIFYMYLVLVNQDLLQRYLKEEQNATSINLSVVIVGFTYYFRLILFDSFKHLLVPLFFVICCSIFLNLQVSAQNTTEIIANYLFFTLYLILQLVESHLVSSRTNQLFFRNYSEELKHINNDGEEMGSNLELISKSELMVEKCDKIIKEIETTRKSIIYNDIKIRLKKTITALIEIKKYLGHSWRSETINFNDNSQIDVDDKEFISQNFLTASKLVPERTRGRQGTLRDMIERRPHFSYSSSMLIEYVNILETLGLEWNFDTMQLQQLTNRSISIIGKHLFQKWFLKDVLCIEQEIAYRFFEHIEIVISNQNYQNNPYHNATHAADVFNSLYYFVKNSGLEKFITPHESVATLVAALGHDLGHPGLTNRYLIAAKHSLAMRYNDISVLENMHCSMIFTLITEPQCNILGNLLQDEWVFIRKLIIEMVLHTDMSRHFEILGRFRTRFYTLNDLCMEKIDDRVFILTMGLKCADLGHSAKSFELHERWTKLVCEEFFTQGDLEKANGMPVSMYCDRETTDISKSQAGFIKNVCMPLYEVFSGFLQSPIIEQKCFEQLKENLNRWEEASRAKCSSVMKMDGQKEEFLIKVVNRKNN